MSFKSLIGRGSEETVQYRFDGDGWVLVQPFEEAPFQQQQQGSGQGPRQSGSGGGQGGTAGGMLNPFLGG